MAAPKVFANTLASRLGHALETSKRSYLTEGGDEGERLKAHALMNSIFKCLFYDRRLGGLGGSFPWRNLTGADRAQCIVNFLKKNEGTRED